MSPEIVIGFFTYQGSKGWPQRWIHTPVQCEPDSGWYQKFRSDGRDLSAGCRWGYLPSLAISLWVASWFLAIRNWLKPERRMLSNHTIISPLGIIFDTLWISSEIFNLIFDTVKPSVTSCGGDVHKFIASGFKLCSLLLVLDVLLFHCVECHLVLLWQQQGEQSTYSWLLGNLQISEIPVQVCF